MSKKIYYYLFLGDKLIILEIEYMTTQIKYSLLHYQNRQYFLCQFINQQR